MPIDTNLKTNMAARFKNRSLTGKFDKIQKRNRGNIVKLQEGLQAWKNKNISSEVDENVDENEEFEPAMDIVINTRESTVGTVNTETFLSL
jgi:predicted HAD superfamily phosphohydrolase YqeG